MRIPRMTPLFLATVLFLAAAAYGDIEAEVIEGLLQNIDSASGEITIVTKDGKTVTLTIDTEAPVESDGTSSTLESLELGASLEVEVDGEAAQRLNGERPHTHRLSHRQHPHRAG